MPSVSIQVFSRFRPRNDIEKLKNTNPKEIIKLVKNGKNVQINRKVDHLDEPLIFTFDNVFTPNTTQPQLFDVVGKDIVDNVLAGYNSTLFAYGQTGSGKTYSLIGEIDDVEKFGVLPRAIKYLFEEISGNEMLNECSIKMQVCEIYLEKLQDLLNPGKRKIRLRQRKDGSTYIENIHEEYVTSLKDVFQFMMLAFKHRKSAATAMNEQSSRSHCVFNFTVRQSLTTGQVKNSKLCIIDLAGSERAAKTGTKGQRFEEAKAINASLSVLGSVINTLSTMEEDGRKRHVPFRNSVLTFLLKDSLSGNTKTALLVCATLDSWNLEETISTMRFAQRAKLIKNKVSVQQELSAEEMKKLITRQKMLIVNACKVMNTIRKEDFNEVNCEEPMSRYEKSAKMFLGEDDYPTTGVDDEKVISESPVDAVKGTASMEEEDNAGVELMLAKVTEIEERMNAQIDSVKKELSKKKTECMALKDELGQKNEVIAQTQKDLEFYKNELKNAPAPYAPESKIDDDWVGKRVTVKGLTGTGKVTKDVGQNIVQVRMTLENGKKVTTDVKITELKEVADNETEAILAKYRRDLRVYKYTLDLTRKEWKKNQTLALEKMNAHRKVISKYKEDKTLLLSIVSDLETKLNEANERLRSSIRKAKHKKHSRKEKLPETPDLESEFQPQNGVMTRKQANALTDFMKGTPTKGESKAVFKKGIKKA